MCIRDRCVCACACACAFFCLGCRRTRVQLSRLHVQSSPTAPAQSARSTSRAPLSGQPPTGTITMTPAEAGAKP
eukprot:12386468-Alexandrium_andersonii.AAC.1